MIATYTAGELSSEDFYIAEELCNRYGVSTSQATKIVIDEDTIKFRIMTNLPWVIQNPHLEVEYSTLEFVVKGETK